MDYMIGIIVNILFAGVLFWTIMESEEIIEDDLKDKDYTQIGFFIAVFSITSWFGVFVYLVVIFAIGILIFSKENS